MTIGFSDFFLSSARTKLSWDSIIEPQILRDLHDNWPFRAPGFGRPDCSKVCIVDIDIWKYQTYFPPCLVRVNADTQLIAEVKKRQDHEDHFISVRGYGNALLNNYLKVVLYSRETLLENDGVATGEYDWEVVAINASPYDNEPMDPTTMARNYLQAPGGTYAPYSAEQFAQAVYFWSQHFRL